MQRVVSARPFVAVRPSVRALRVQRVSPPAAEQHPMDPSIDWAAYKKHENDTGSAGVQVAMMSARISHLSKHLESNRKDHSCTRGLMKLLGQRKRMLQYLYSSDKEAFAKVVRGLRIRNPVKGVVISREDDEVPAPQS